MSDSEEEIPIFLEDRIIIENIEKNSFLYDPQGYIGIPGDLNENKITVYKRIAAKILKCCDKEYTWQEVKKRWRSIRNSYTKALRLNKDYYLQDYLQFLKPHIKSKPAAKSTSKYKPLNVSPVHTLSDVSLSEEEEGGLFDKIQQKMKDQQEGYGNENQEKLKNENNNENKKLLSNDLENIQVAKSNENYWDINSASNYFQHLKEDLRNVPENVQVACIIEIFETAKKYVLK